MQVLLKENAIFDKLRENLDQLKDWFCYRQGSNIKQAKYPIFCLIFSEIPVKFRFEGGLQ